MLSLRKQGIQADSRRGNVSRVLHYCFGALCGLVIFFAISNSYTVKAQSQNQHKAVLGWATYVQGTDIAVGLNIGRSTVSGGPYTIMNTTLIPVSSTTYTDTSVVSGATYFYVLNAQDANGFVSGFSAESLPATIPGNPSIPTRPTITVQ